VTETQIKEVVVKLLKGIAPEADPAHLAPDQNVRESLDIDSYDFLQFLIALDEQLGVDIPEADYGKLITLSDIIDYLADRAAKVS
jgi:acyl carrier protein